MCKAVFDDEFRRGVETSPAELDIIKEELREADLLRMAERSLSNWVASLDIPPKEDQEVPKRIVYLSKTEDIMARRIQQTWVFLKLSVHLNLPNMYLFFPTDITSDSTLETSLTNELLDFSPEELLPPTEEDPELDK